MFFCEKCKETILWDKISSEIKKIGYELSSNIFELFIFVIDSDGPDNLSAIKQEYSILIDLAKNDYSRYREIYDNLEGFLRKVLYLVDNRLYNESRRDCNKGLYKLCELMNLKNSDRFSNLPSERQAKISTIIGNAMHIRNDNSHNANNSLKAFDDEIIWKPLFVELLSIIVYKDSLIEIKNTYNDELLDKTVILYCKHQIEKYQAEDFEYIQIEYENTKNPEEFDDEESFELTKGTADTLMKTINFEVTPKIKLIAPAGMGKTKMLEYLNYKFSSELVNENKKIFPMLIYCNDATGDIKNYNFKDTFFSKIRLSLNSIGYDNIPEEAFYKYLNNNYKIFFLIDGLNEITRSRKDKNKFINSLQDFIKNNKNYFIMTERYSRDAITITRGIEYYKFSEISEEIKKLFFKAKGIEVLLERLNFIKSSFDSNTQKEMNELLRTPFYLSVICQMSDAILLKKDEQIPKTKFELMDLFLKELIKREREKGETTANITYIRYYLLELATLTNENNQSTLENILEAFSNITDKYGLNKEDYSSDHLVELFEQLGFINVVNDTISVNDIYAEYINELLLMNI